MENVIFFHLLLKRINRKHNDKRKICIVVQLSKYSGLWCVGEKLKVIGNLRMRCCYPNAFCHRCTLTTQKQIVVRVVVVCRSVQRDHRPCSRLLFYPTRFRINFSVLYAHRTGRAKIVKKTNGYATSNEPSSHARPPPPRVCSTIVYCDRSCPPRPPALFRRLVHPVVLSRVKNLSR